MYFAKAGRDGFMVRIVDFDGTTLTYKNPNGVTMTVDITRFNRDKDWDFYRKLDLKELENAFKPEEVKEPTYKELQTQYKEKTGKSPVGKSKEEIINALQTS